ncbi:hypothetical protein HK405_009279, partial [Cladochytrium tenue]
MSAAAPPVDGATNGDGAQPTSAAALRAAFEAFATFGGSRNLAAAGADGHSPSSSAATPAAVTMDSARFAKLVREAGVLAALGLGPADADVVFEKSRPVGGPRRLDFRAFRAALRGLAERGGGEYADVVARVVEASPVIYGTVPDIDPVLEKLTDASLYTGTHKHRFDPSTGVGRGLEGREPVSTTASLATIVSRHNPHRTLGATSGGSAASVAAVAARSGSFSSTPPRTGGVPVARTGSNGPVGGAGGARGGGGGSSAGSGGGSGGNVFSRLTSVDTFTGTHRHRFNSDGTGRGKAGRTGDGAGDVVADLSQITRR